MALIPQPINNAPQTFNFPSATVPLPLSTNVILPFTIDPLAYISDVYDSLFASQVAGTTPLIKNIRSILIKKLLLDQAAQELRFHSILTVDDLIAFTRNILHRTAIIP